MCTVAVEADTVLKQERLKFWCWEWKRRSECRECWSMQRGTWPSRMERGLPVALRHLQVQTLGTGDTNMQQKGACSQLLD